MGNSVSGVVDGTVDVLLNPLKAMSTSAPNNVTQNIDVAIEVLKKDIFQALKGYDYSDEDCHIITDVLIYAELRGNNQGIVKLVTGGLKPTCPSKLEIIQDLYKKYNPTKLQVFPLYILLTEHFLNALTRRNCPQC